MAKSQFGQQFTPEHFTDTDMLWLGEAISRFANTQIAEKTDKETAARIESIAIVAVGFFDESAYDETPMTLEELAELKQHPLADWLTRLYRLMDKVDDRTLKTFDELDEIILQCEQMMSEVDILPELFTAAMLDRFREIQDKNREGAEYIRNKIEEMGATGQEGVGEILEGAFGAPESPKKGEGTVLPFERSPKRPK